eukprot:CAMPEP_0168591674 /NCGR_PEP_ID=MMETSP0420-20121227/7270_1 /TAXON_ID=498008 /ORGANISM="Pessonella sp." /LENGTH=286 /DNA_ID=CAMNT_0008627501 /DNA_START=28 /DNA_END=885 /DNA_ORIENTATION=+
MICLFFILILILCCNAYLDAPKIVRVIGSGAEPGQNDNGYSSDNQQKFEPNNVSIYEGDSVLWTWEGGAAHNVAQSFDAHQNQSLFNTHGIDGFGVDPRIKGELLWTFDKAGVYYYVCEPHAEYGMKGVVHVLKRDVPLSDAPLFDEKDISESNENSNNNQQQPAGPPATKSFLDNLVLNNAPQAAHVTTAALAQHDATIVTNVNADNDDTQQHTIVTTARLATFNVQQPSSKPMHFNRTVFGIVLLIFGLIALVLILFCAQRRKRQKKKSHVVLHAPSEFRGRFD